MRYSSSSISRISPSSGKKTFTVVLCTLVKFTSTGMGERVGAAMMGSGVSDAVSASPGRAQARTTPTISSTTATSRAVSPSRMGQWMV